MESVRINAVLRLFTSQVFKYLFSFQNKIIQVIIFSFFSIDHLLNACTLPSFFIEYHLGSLIKKQKNM